MDEQLAQQKNYSETAFTAASKCDKKFDVDVQQKYSQLQNDYTVLEYNYTEALDRIKFFEEQIRLLRHKQFGPSSEKTSPEQGLLFSQDNTDELPASPEETSTVTYQRKKTTVPKRNQFPIHWPRREIIHDIHEKNKINKEGDPLKVIGFDEFEQVSVSPASYEVIIHKRPKYAKALDDGCTQILQAPPAIVPLRKSIATPSLLADIITSKFVEHLPLNRYEQRCARQDFALSRATQSRWLIRLCEENSGLLLPLVFLILDYLRELKVMHCDETRFQVFNDILRQNPDSSYAYAWLLAGNAKINGKAVKLAYYHYSPSKAADVIDTLLGDFSGHLVVDGYSGFDRVERQRNGTESPIILSGCWDHSRRRYKEAEKGLKKGDKKINLTHQGTALVNKLYQIEREIKESPPDEKLAYRQLHTVPALEALKSWLDKNQPNLNPKGLLGQAISYTQNQFHKLERFAYNGELPISNIFCEQQAKKFAVGRNNWMFANTPAGAKASCALYTLAVTACLNQVDPFAYFRYILAVLPTATTVEELERLLPWNVDTQVIKDFDEFSYCQGKPEK